MLAVTNPAVRLHSYLFGEGCLIMLRSQLLVVVDLKNTAL